MVLDNAGNPVQGFFAPKRSATVGYNTASGATRLSGETGLARIITTTAAYLAFGGAAIVATGGGLLIPANVPCEFVLPEGNNYVAFKGSGEAGIACLTDLG
jgi:hypothetical protein